MKRKIRTVDTLRKLATQIRQELAGNNFDIVAGLLGDVAFKAIKHVAKRQGMKVRGTWAQLRPIVPTLAPPLKRDYTAVVNDARALDKDARYADDEWECDEDKVRDIAERVLKLVDDVCQVAP